MPTTRFCTIPSFPISHCSEVKDEYLESVDGMVGNYEFAIDEKKQELGVSGTVALFVPLSGWYGLSSIEEKKQELGVSGMKL